LLKVYILPGRLWRQKQVEQVIAGVRQKNIVLDTVLVLVHDTVHMTAMTYTAARENLASTMDRVCVDHDPVIITRNRDQAVVMLSLDDYESLQETAYLLRTPTNAKRLISSIESLNS
jgi:antitoxin YefM